MNSIMAGGGWLYMKWHIILVWFKIKFRKIPHSDMPRATQPHAGSASGGLRLDKVFVVLVEHKLFPPPYNCNGPQKYCKSLA